MFEDYMSSRLSISSRGIRSGRRRSCSRWPSWNRSLSSRSWCPAWGALVLIGTLIAAGGLNFWPIWVAGSVGAALGDWLSYWIG